MHTRISAVSFCAVLLLLLTAAEPPSAGARRSSSGQDGRQLPYGSPIIDYYRNPATRQSYYPYWYRRPSLESPTWQGPQSPYLTRKKTLWEAPTTSERKLTDEVEAAEIDYGPDHPETYRRLWTAAEHYRKVQKYDQAKPLLDKLLSQSPATLAHAGISRDAVNNARTQMLREMSPPSASRRAYSRYPWPGSTPSRWGGGTPTAPYGLPRPAPNPQMDALGPKFQIPHSN